jgi:hypothetical protein
MGWIPDIISTLINIKNIEEGQNDLVYSSSIFWLFCNHTRNDYEFNKRISFYKERIAEGKGFTDPEIESLIIRASENTDKVVQLLVNRFENIAAKKRPHNISGLKDGLSPLVVFTHIESARLAMSLVGEGYSDKSRAILANALKAFYRCEKFKLNSEGNHIPKYILASLKAVGSYLTTTQFIFQKTDCQYEKALKSFLKAIEFALQSQLNLTPDERNGIWRLSYKNTSDIPVIEYDIHDIKNSVARIIKSPFQPMVSGSGTPESWINILTPQATYECFEPLKNSGKIDDPESLASACNRLIELYQTNTLNMWSKTVITDSDDFNWEPNVYWYKMLGWVEAQLNHSSLRKYLHASEDIISEKRLNNYFFADEIWRLIPNRARGSLINADRDWFCGPKARKEALLTHIKVAVEELISQGLWKPLSQWMLKNDDRRRLGKDFSELEKKLYQIHHNPTLFDFEKMLGFQVTYAYLTERGVPQLEREWLTKELPRLLSTLRVKRDKAEHESLKWTDQQLRIHFNTYIGIGKPGIIQRLVSVLLLTPGTRNIT